MATGKCNSFHAGLVQSEKVGKKTMVFSKIRENRKSQRKSGNSFGVQGEMYSLKFKSHEVSNLQYFLFNGFTSFEILLFFDCRNKK